MTLARIKHLLEDERMDENQKTELYILNNIALHAYEGLFTSPINAEGHGSLCCFNQ